MASNSKRMYQIASLLVIPLLTLGCATKKFVRNTVSPLEARLGTNEQKTKDNSDQIKDVDRRAESGISDAANRADQAAQAANTAQQSANQAQDTAQKGLSQANQAMQDVQNVDNFKPVKTVTVLFGFNHSNLTDDDKQKLEDLASAAAGMKHYVLEVQGYTDSTGPASYNLELSRRRAQAAVRYLTLDQKIPLVRVFLLGYGENAPAAPNKTREGRKENRRVEITLMSPQMGQEAQASTPTNTNSETPMNQNQK
jgi:OmpA-OmpF porin, OOP family